MAEEQNAENVENLDLGKAKSKKSSKVMLYVCIVLALLALGLSGALYYVIKVKPKDAVEEVEAEPVHRDPIYIAVDKDILINLPPETGSRFLQVGITVLVFDATAAGILKKHMPVLRNNISLVLGTMDPMELKTAAGKLELQARVLEEVNSLIQQQAPDSSAEQIFFTSFLFQ